MTVLTRLLLLCSLLAACTTAPATSDASCCAAPEPGTVRVHIGGTVGAVVGITR